MQASLCGQIAIPEDNEPRSLSRKQLADLQQDEQQQDGFVLRSALPGEPHFLCKLHRQVLMRFFDFQNHNELNFLRFKLVLKIMLFSYAKLTSQPFSDLQELDTAIQDVLSKSDLGLQDSLSFQDTVNWVQGNQTAFQMFKRFQPKIQTPQNFMILAPFHSMSPSQAQAYFQLISNSYKRVNYEQVLNINYPRKRTVSERSPQHFMKSGRGSSLRETQLRLPTLTEIKRSPQAFKTIKVSTISKRKVIELKDYFDHLANKGRVIRFNEFEEAISKRNLTASNNVISSLFNFLDQQHQGVISFPQLVKALFPKIKARQLQEIDKLSKKLQFSKSGIKPKQNKQTEQMLTFLKKKKELPSRCLKSLRRLFDFFDEGKKGFLNFKDFKKNFCYSYDSKDIEELIRKYDKDGDGKLQFEEFVRMLLPQGFSIDGFEG